jgi:HAD superfamily hydrolase (TIGR01509 family)
MYKDFIDNYLKAHNYKAINLKAVLFDMDGVLFNSMPYHATSWHKVMTQHGLPMSMEEAYLHEGRTGAGTINLVARRTWGREATEEEINQIYKDKTSEFSSNPPAAPMPGVLEVLQQIKADGLTIMVVTGSGQKSLLNRLESKFPHIFQKELMVTAFDVKFGKPNPEPYLMALKKGHLQPNEAIIVENAPLGVQAGHAAGVFTLAVNTGPMDDQVLWDAGADMLLPSMPAFCDEWENIRQAMNKQ